MEPSHYEWECKMGRLLWKTVWQVLKILVHDPAISLLGVYTQGD